FAPTVADDRLVGVAPKTRPNPIDAGKKREGKRKESGDYIVRSSAELEDPVSFLFATVGFLFFWKILVVSSANRKDIRSYVASESSPTA
uniref:Uncharacterized protein n=1 Tax=Anopheles albimanus TaxID=7167 RepID=A0A182FZB7_ANOAL